MKKYGKRVIGVILMVLAMVLTQIPMPVLEATSATADFERDGDTLIHYTGTASAVSVPAGIREIAPEAFKTVSQRFTSHPLWRRSERVHSVIVPI